MKIGFDIDGVLADFNRSFIQRVIDVTGEDKFPPRPFDIPTWNYPEHYGYNSEQVAAVWENIKADKAFWFGLSRYTWTMSNLTQLQHWQQTGKHDIYFITSRPGVNAKQQTEGWLLMNGFAGCPTVLVSSNKGAACKALGLDFYVDDYQHNTDDVYFNSDTQVFLFDQPWNRYGSAGYPRITALEEMFARLS